MSSRVEVRGVTLTVCVGTGLRRMVDGYTTVMCHSGDPSILKISISLLELFWISFWNSLIIYVLNRGNGFFLTLGDCHVLMV